MAETVCPERDQLRKFLLGNLEPQQQQAVLDHVELCPECQATADTINLGSDTLVSGLNPQPSTDEFEAEKECEKALEAVQSIVPEAGEGKAAGITPPDSLNDVTLVYGTTDSVVTSEVSSTGQTVVPADTQDGSEGSSKFGVIPEQFGRYQILEILGQGGMGAVYLAKDPDLDRKLAIKVPFVEVADKSAVLDRFRREARAVAQIHHPNICPIYEVSEVDGIHYMAMAFIQGKPLNKFIRPDKPLPIRQVAKLVRLIAIALEQAHEVGVIHRDLKPANIMINKKSQPVIMDFGLARREGTSDTQLTQAGQIMGTPLYMSPEQVSGDVERMGPACDVYSLGVIMYEMLTGQVPFTGDLLALLTAIATKDPDPPSQRRSDIDANLESICLKAMAKQVADRYASMTEFAEALGNYLKSDNEHAPIEQSATSLPSVTAGNTQPTIAFADNSTSGADEKAKPDEQGSTSLATSKPASPPNRRRKLAIAIAAGAGGVLLLLGVIVLLLPSKNGTIRIEINDPEIEVTVGSNGYTIKGASKKEISLEPGEHLLTIKRGDDFDFQTDKFVLSKGETVILKVEYIKDKITVRNGETLIGKSEIHGTGKPPVVNAGPTSRSDYALAFDGQDDYVDIPTLKIPNGPFTIEAIVELETLPQGSKLANIVSDTGGAFYLTANPKDGFTLLLSDDKRQYAGQLPNASALKKRVLVSAVFDGKNFTLTANGKRFSSSSDKFAGMKGHVVLGVNPKIRSCFHGTLHELRISKVARNAPEIDTSMRMESDSDTLALYHFDEGQGGDLKDSSGNDHHGKTVGTKWIRVEPTTDTSSSDISSASVPPPAIAPFDADQARKHQQAWADYLGLPVEFTNKLGMKFTLIPPGTFLMGSPQQEERRLPNESKQYTATLTKPFYMAVTELTQQQYVELVGKNPSYLSPTGGWKDRVAGLDTSQHPVESIRWSETIEFCNKLSKYESVRPHYLRDGDRVRDQAGEGYRLPTEAEWEFACRAGTTTPFHFGATISTDEANYDGMYAYGDGKTGEDLDRSTPVASFPSNAFGLFDMHGNVWEFCWDWLADYPSGSSTDYRGPDSGKERLIRGGSWDNHVPDLRSARRGGASPGGTGAVVGFRVCVSVDALDRTNKRPSLGKAPFDATQAKAHQQAWARHLGLPVEKVVELPGGEKMTFVLVPPGEFMMGSSDAQRAEFLVEAAANDSRGNLDRIPFEAPQHPVRISQPFYMGKFEVTQRQWEAVIGNNPSKFKHPTNPVENISWHDIQLLLAKVNQHAPPGFRFVLPTEAQWEYACRAGTMTAWSCGNDDDEVQNYAFVRTNAPEGPKPVGQLEPNAWSIYDMHGNVWEWCADSFEESYYANSPMIDPSGPSTGSLRVDRGGGWSYDARDCRSAYRNRSAPDAKADVIGFRLAMIIDTAKLGRIPAPDPNAGTDQEPVTSPIHKAAKWVMGIGGEIHIGSEVISSIKDLPSQPFEIGVVDLSKAQFSADQIKILTGLSALEGLDLAYSSIDDAGLKRLASLKSLHWISLAYANNVTGAGLEHLKKLPSLRELNLEGCSIKVFSQLEDFTSLEHLSLLSTSITDSELVHVRKMKQLTHLNLDSTNVGDKGLVHLKQLTNLKDVRLTQTKVTPAAAQMLSKALPECKIHCTIDDKVQALRDGVWVSP